MDPFSVLFLLKEPKEGDEYLKYMFPKESIMKEHAGMILSSYGATGQIFSNEQLIHSCTLCYGSLGRGTGFDVAVHYFELNTSLIMAVAIPKNGDDFVLKNISNRLFTLFRFYILSSVPLEKRDIVMYLVEHKKRSLNEFFRQFKNNYLPHLRRVDYQFPTTIVTHPRFMVAESRINPLVLSLDQEIREVFQHFVTSSFTQKPILCSVLGYTLFYGRYCVYTDLNETITQLFQDYLSLHGYTLDLVDESTTKDIENEPFFIKQHQKKKKKRKPMKLLSGHPDLSSRPDALDNLVLPPLEQGEKIWIDEYNSDYPFVVFKQHEFFLFVVMFREERKKNVGLDRDEIREIIAKKKQEKERQDSELFDLSSEGEDFDRQISDDSDDGNENEEEEEEEKENKKKESEEEDDENDVQEEEEEESDESGGELEEGGEEQSEEEESEEEGEDDESEDEEEIEEIDKENVTEEEDDDDEEQTEQTEDDEQTETEETGETEEDEDEVSPKIKEEVLKIKTEEETEEESEEDDGEKEDSAIDDDDDEIFQHEEDLVIEEIKNVISHFKFINSCRNFFSKVLEFKNENQLFSSSSSSKSKKLNLWIFSHLNKRMIHFSSKKSKSNSSSSSTSKNTKKKKKNEKSQYEVSSKELFLRKFQSLMDMARSSPKSKEIGLLYRGNWVILRNTGKFKFVISFPVSWNKEKTVTLWMRKLNLLL